MIFFQQSFMHELWKICNIRSSTNFRSWNITDQSFNSRIRWNNLTKSLTNNLTNFLCSYWLILSFKIKSIKFCIWNYRGRIKFNFIWSKRFIIINLPKSINIFLKTWSIKSRHNMNWHLKSILPKTIHCNSNFLNSVTSFIHFQDLIISRLNSHFNPCNSHLSSLTTVSMGNKRRCRLNG